jgi:hypothetical protein
MSPGARTGLNRSSQHWLVVPRVGAGSALRLVCSSRGSSAVDCSVQRDRSWISVMTSASQARRIARLVGAAGRHRKNPDGATARIRQHRLVPWPSLASVSTTGKMSFGRTTRPWPNSSEARLTVASSASSSVIRCRAARSCADSTVGVPDSSPLSILSWRTHRYTVAADTPIPAATSSALRPERTCSTTIARNCGAYEWACLPPQGRPPFSQAKSTQRGPHQAGQSQGSGQSSSDAVRASCARQDHSGGAGSIEVMSKSSSRRFPVTITQLPVTRCQICHRTIAYRPGNLSEVLTEHYRRAHPEALGAPSR